MSDLLVVVGVDREFMDRSTAIDDSEISIFDAQKYFNEADNKVSDDDDVKVKPAVSSTVNVNDLQRISLPPPRLSTDGGGYGRNYRARSFNTTPTASSEASWNSKTGLLSNPPGAIAVSMRNPTTGGDHHEIKRRDGSANKWRLFGRKCPCSGKKSVQVEETLSEPKTPVSHLYSKNKTLNSVEISSVKSNWMIPLPPTPSTTTHRISAACSDNGFSSLGQRVIMAGSGSRRPYTDGTRGFTFPVLNQTSPIKLRLNAPPLLEDPPRESLEIFQPSYSTGAMMAVTMEDDVASDASSDLFEIESFSTQTTTALYPMYHCRDSLDEASSFNARRLAAAANINGGFYCGRRMEEAMAMKPPAIISAAAECYEPSEASIDWSVTTAEGFDRGSVVTNFSVSASEIDHMRHGHQSHQKKNDNDDVNGGGHGRSKKGNGGGLLLSCRCEKAVSVGPNPVKFTAAAAAESTSTSKHANYCRPSKPPLARSHSARLSLPFAA